MSITAAELIALVKVSGADEAAAKLVSLGGTVEGVGGKLGKLATGAVLVAGAAFIGLGALSVKMAADFQQGLTLLTTSANESQQNLSMVGAGILKMSVDTATGADKLETAMFTVESAGYHGAAGLKVLQAAAEGAKIENADLAQVTQALAITMHDWQEPANQAIDVMNSFREAAALGNMRMDDFTGAMRTVGPVASLAKIPLTDIEAALSTMSLEGDKGASAGTHLAQSLLNMIAPSTKAQGVLKEIGLTAQQVSDDMQKSLPDTLKEITDDIGKKFPKGSEAYNHALSDMFGGTRGLKAILELTGANLKDFTNDAADLAPIMKQNANNVDGWSKVQENFNFKLDAAKNAVQALMINLGTALLPVLGKLADQVTPLITEFSDWAVKSGVLNQAAIGLQNTISTTASTIQGTIGTIQAVIGFYTQWQFPINSVAFSLSVFFIPALIKSGVEALISSAKISYSFVASLIAVGVQGWAAGVSLTILVAKFIATQIAATAAAAVVAGQFVLSVAKVGAQAAITALTMDATLVPSIALFASTAIMAATTAIAPFVIGLGVAAAAAWTLAAAVIAATWPILAAIAAIALIVAAVNNWGAITTGFSNLWSQAMKNVNESTHQAATGVATSMEKAESRTKVAVGDISYDVEASTGRIIHATKQAATDATDNFRNITVAGQTMARNLIRAMGDIKDKGGQSFDDLLKQVGIDMQQIDDTATQYWADVMHYIDNHPINGHITYTTAGGDIGVQQSATTGHNAGGTDNWRGGWSWVGEKGPELMNIPRGAQIIPHDRSVAAASGGGQPVQININIAGHRVAQTLLPDIVQAVRSHTGIRY